MPRLRLYHLDCWPFSLRWRYLLQEASCTFLRQITGCNNNCISAQECFCGACTWPWLLVFVLVAVTSLLVVKISIKDYSRLFTLHRLPRRRWGSHNPQAEGEDGR